MAAHDEPAHLSRSDRDPVQVRRAHVGPAKSRAGEVDLLKVAVHEPGPREVSATKVRLADPTRARQALRTMLKDGIIELEPQPDGTYIARGTVFPLMPLLLQPLERPKPRDREAEGLQVVYRSSCAGRI